MNGFSKDITQEQLEKLSSVFPEVVKDGKVDWDTLKQTLGESIASTDERYGLSWAGKANAFRAIQEPTSKTLKPDFEESVNFDDTENIFIEGDNLEALKILQKSYFGKVKMIYIDPPYNTGKDFVYRDRFQTTQSDYRKESGIDDEEGNRRSDGLFTNSKDGGHYHSNWLNMMYPRLYLARNLMRDDGVIFISIDDHEVHNLRMICNEIFGEENFVEHFVWKSGRTSSSIYTREHEYVIAFCKNKEKLELLKFNGDEKISDRAIKKITKKNPATEICFSAGSVRFVGGDQVFPKEFGGSEKIKVTDGSLEFKNGTLVKDVCLEAGWAMKDMIESWLAGDSNVIDSKGQQVDEFFFKENGVLQYIKNKGTIHPRTIITEATTKKGTNELKDLLDFSPFDYPKATDLIRFFLTHTKDSDIILDFFAGSSTTAHAVMIQNAEDGGNRKYIMVQLDEETDEKSEAHKSGYKTIAQLAQERIRRAGQKILKEKAMELAPRETPLDIGFKAFKVSDSSFRKWQYNTTDPEVLAEQLKMSLDTLEKNAEDENIFYELLIKAGYTPTDKIKKNKDGYYLVNDTELAVVIRKDSLGENIQDILERGVEKVIFVERVFGNSDEIKVNTTLQLKQAGIEVKVV